jgi:putative resolvase
MQDRRIEVINLAENGKEDLIQDFVSIVTSFCARLYGQRRSKRKTERMIAELAQSPVPSVSSPGA